MSNTFTNQANNLENAISAFQSGDLLGALVICKKLTKEKKFKLDAFNLAGIIADKMNDKSSAIEYFQNAVKLSPNNPQILTNLASTLIELNEYKQAKSYLLTATQGNSKYADAYYNLGNIYLIEENIRAAKKAYQKAIDLNPNHFRALNNLATIYKKSDEVDAAINSYEKAINIHPGFSEALEGLGAIYYEKEEYEPAEKYLKQALNFNQHLANANFLLGRIYLYHHENEESALPYLNAAYSLLPNDENISNIHGELQYKKGDLEKAKSLFLNSIQYNPDQISPLNFLGQIFQEQREYEIANSYFEKALEIDPENSLILNNYGHFLREMGDLDKSIEILEKSISIDSSLPPQERSSALNNIALTQLLKQDFANGWKNYRYRRSITESELPICQDNDSISLDGKRILFLHDQGIGDELFFLRFSPLLESFGSQFFYQASNKIYPIIRDLKFFNSVFTDDYNQNEYDNIFSIGDLPYLLRHSSKENIPNPLTLNSNKIFKEEIKNFLQTFGPPPYIGITWKAGRLIENKRISAYHKFLDLNNLIEMLKPIKGTIISIQVNAEKKDLEYLSVNLQRPILDVSTYHNQLDKMLCMLDLLDHYLAVSNTYVHMREGTNKKSHVFVNSPPEWRWLAEGDQTFWMPNSNVYRQLANGSWENAVQQFQNKIHELP